MASTKIPLNIIRLQWKLVVREVTDEFNINNATQKCCDTVYTINPSFNTLYINCKRLTDSSGKIIDQIEAVKVAEDRYI